jgi:methyl-accepting chemotaxis protein
LAVHRPAKPESPTGKLDEPLENTMSKDYRRKKYYFKESTQGKYIFSYFILSALVMGLFTLLLVLFSMNTLSINFDGNTFSMDQTPRVLLDRLLGIHGILISLFGISLIYFVTRFTHKTIGPLYKISRTIDAMTAGDLSQHIHLRKHDECKDIAEILNHCNSTLASKISDIHLKSLEMNELIMNSSEGLPDGALSPDQAETLDRIRHLNGEILQSLSFFKLSDDKSED